MLLIFLWAFSSSSSISIWSLWMPTGFLQHPIDFQDFYRIWLIFMIVRSPYATHVVEHQELATDQNKCPTALRWPRSRSCYQVKVGGERWRESQMCWCQLERNRSVYNTFTSFQSKMMVVSFTHTVGEIAMLKPPIDDTHVLVENNTIGNRN